MGLIRRSRLACWLRWLVALRQTSNFEAVQRCRCLKSTSQQCKQALVFRLFSSSGARSIMFSSNTCLYQFASMFEI